MPIITWLNDNLHSDICRVQNHVFIKTIFKEDQSYLLTKHIALFHWQDINVTIDVYPEQKIICPEVLYEEVVEVRERIVPRLDTSTEEIVLEKWTVEQGSTGEELLVMKQVDEVQLRQDLQQILDKGITSLAVVLLHSYM